MKLKRKANLATTLTVNSNYVGEWAGEFISAAWLAGSTLSRDLVTFKPGVAKELFITKMSVDNLIGPATCKFTPSGTIQLSDKSLLPIELQVNLEICKQDLINSWEAEQVMKNGALNKNIAPKFDKYLIGDILGSVAESLEKTIWHGDKAVATEFDGLVTGLTADTDTIKIAGVAITAANVIAELTKVYNKIPDTVIGESDFSIYVASNVYRAYQLALSALGFKQEFYVGLKPADFAGLPVVLIPGLKPGFMVAAQKSNLWVGTALKSDYNKMQVIDMNKTTGDDMIRYIMKFTGDSNHGIGAEVVLYSAPTP